MSRNSKSSRSRVMLLALVASVIAITYFSLTSSRGGGVPIDFAKSLPRDIAKGYNLLFLSVDTLRADHLGCYGAEFAVTPTIDALCDRGVRFSRAMAATPVTLPSHSSMMTGLYPPSHGVRANGVFKLEPKHTTLAETLGIAGYDTAAFIGAHVLDSQYGLDQGFALYDDNLRPTDGSPRFFVERNAASVTDSVSQWLDSRPNPATPFFAWVHYFDPHIPYEAPPEFAASMVGKHPYDTEIAYVDTQIARLLAKLDALGQRDKTLICLTSDHGESLGEHGETTHSIFIYDATLRVPMILSSASLFDDRYVFDHGVVCLADLFPTLVSLLGVVVPAGTSFDGIDIAARIPDADRAVYIESMPPRVEYGWSSLHGLSRLNDKYIKAPISEYYDLKKDPGELTNRFGAGSSRQLEGDLAKLMANWESEEEALARRLELDPQQLARLQNLGYMRSVGGDAAPGTKDPKAMVKMWERIQRAEALSAANRHADAVEAIREVLQEDPRNSKAWYAATRIYRLAGNSGSAFKAVQIAVDLSPRPEGYVVLANYSFQNQLFDQASDACAKALEMDPHHGGVFILMGDILATQGAYAEARLQFQKALEVDPGRSGTTARQKIELIDQRLKQQP